MEDWVGLGKENLPWRHGIQRVSFDRGRRELDLGHLNFYSLNPLAIYLFIWKNIFKLGLGNLFSTLNGIYLLICSRCFS